MSLRVAQGKIQAAKELVDENETALQEFFDSHSERWQESDAASDIEDKIDTLNDIASELEEAYYALESQIGSITEAME